MDRRKTERRGGEGGVGAAVGWGEWGGVYEYGGVGGGGEGVSGGWGEV